MKKWIAYACCCLISFCNLLLQRNLIEVASAEPADCKTALKIQQSSLSLSYDALEQSPNQGWRSLSKINCYQEAARLIISYFDTNPQLHHQQEFEILSFHAGQMFSYNNNYYSAIPLFKNSFSRTGGLPLEYKQYADAWDAYVNATIAFLERDKPALEAYRAQVAVGPKLPNGEVMNLAVVDRLIKNFGKPYHQAYGGR